MEPRPFARLSVAALSLRMPQGSSKAARGAVLHSSTSPCFAEMKLPGFDLQTAPVPLHTRSSDPDPHHVAASFYLDEPAIKALLAAGSSCFSSPPSLQVVIYTGRQGSCCGASSAKVLGRFSVPVGCDWGTSKSVQLHHGWVAIGRKMKVDQGRVEAAASAELHLSVKIEPDPRYIFQFDGEPEQSPQIVQVQGNIRQPIFTCKFTRDRSFRSRAGQLDGITGNGWAPPVIGSEESERERKERKGWILVIHDLCGSPVAAASMVTPFVPSAGTQRVSRSNPGAWLIMRAGPGGEGSWRPWGRLEAWRERGGKGGGLGCRFQLMAEVAGVSSLVAESVISSQKGGRFLLDTVKLRPQDSPVSASPVDSPHSSGDFYFSLGLPVAAGFVMSADVQGEGRCSKPRVQLASRHVTCMEDAAVFMALTAAVDLSMDACLPFNKKLSKNFTSNHLHS